MVARHDPILSLQTNLHEFESIIRRTAKDMELHWFRHQNSSSENAQFPSQPFSAEPQNENRFQDPVLRVDRKKGFSLSMCAKMPLKAIFGSMFLEGKNGLQREELKVNDEPCISCFSGPQFAAAWSMLLNGLAKALPGSSKKSCRKQCRPEEDPFSSSIVDNSSEAIFRGGKEDNFFPFELFLGFVFDLNAQITKSDHTHKESNRQNLDSLRCAKSTPSHQAVQFRALSDFLQRWKADANGFLTNLKFAKVGGLSSNLSGIASSESEGRENPVSDSREDLESDIGYTQKLANGLLNIPLANVERLKSTLSTVSLPELIEFVPQLGRTSKDYPDKKKLISVQDFFRYTESEGRRFFEELDRDGDGQVTLEDLEVAMAKRRLPRRYARDLLHQTRSHLFSKSIGWKQFLTLMEQREPTILRAYTALCLSKSGTLQKSQLLSSLKSACFPANDDSVSAMLRCLDADKDGDISYGHFRNFMLLLPSERLEGDPRSIWFEAATVVAMPPPVEIPAENVIKSALAGGLACAFSTSVMHPIDTMKTRVQTSTLSFPEVVSKLPEVGIHGLYRGSIPAILGQFSSHGLRNGIFEASKLMLIKVGPTLPEFQVQTLASFCSTVLGTAVRIPCEVLKQRLQAGIFDNVGEAVVGTFQQDGIRGFFRGTGATLCREVPFYVAGMGLYEETKKAAQRFLNRDLEPWETVAVGALSGGLAAVVTTPFDVMKTRIMTAPLGAPVSMSIVALSIIHQEGPLGLFKGAVPRFFWIAPLGAMNFAGYELAKKAMNKCDHSECTRLPQNRLANAG